MFAKNSRYVRLPESSPVNARGERLRGKDLRRIAASTGSFRHTVQSRDRLDLLALKYYSEATKWWQISDANPAFAFPVDLLDRAPIYEETFALVNAAAEDRFNQFVQDLTGIVSVRAPRLDFSESSLIVLNITPLQRALVLTQIQAHGLLFLRSFAWVDGMNDGELFNWEDRDAKKNWHLLMESLAGTPGILHVQSQAEEGLLRVVYNQAAVERTTILRQIGARGYVLDPEASQAVERVGSLIVIPPNQAS